MTNEGVINTLLYEEESTTLDFKSEQYRFIKANDGEKVELLKDVIAFANAWRHSDAYILIGVREVKGERAIVEGITDHLDDAQIQEFIQYKVNKPIRFSYATVEVEGKKIGLITIPVQDRPFYLKKDFANLKANTVYLRRGSSTAIALPEEIAQMGLSSHIEPQRLPKLHAFIVRGEHDEIKSDEINVSIENAIVPEKDDFSPYGEEDYHHHMGRIIPRPVLFNYKNQDYHSEFAVFWQKIKSMFPVRFGVENNGNLVARDVKVILDFQGLPDNSYVCHKRDIPRVPKKTFEIYDLAGLHNKIEPDDLKITKTQLGYQVVIMFGKVQAHESLNCNEYLCLKVLKSCHISVDVTIYSDDLDKPEKSKFKINVVSTRTHYSVKEIIELSE
jgi:hypothetical protein